MYFTTFIFYTNKFPIFVIIDVLFLMFKMKLTIFSCFVLFLSFSFLHEGNLKAKGVAVLCHALTYKNKKYLSFIYLSSIVNGIQCYQCSTSSDPKGSDNCGAYEKFHKDRHIPVECTSDESHTPGTFCVKVTKQGLRGFICKLDVLNTYLLFYNY